MEDRELSRRARPGSTGGRLPTTQPARAVTALGLYVLAVAVLTLLLALRSSGYALLVIATTLSAGLTVPFIVLGQRPDAPEATFRASFPVLVPAPGAAVPGAAGEHDAPARLAPQQDQQQDQAPDAGPAR